MNQDHNFTIEPGNSPSSYRLGISSTPHERRFSSSKNAIRSELSVGVQWSNERLITLRMKRRNLPNSEKDTLHWKRITVFSTVEHIHGPWSTQGWLNGHRWWKWMEWTSVNCCCTILMGIMQNSLLAWRSKESIRTDPDIVCIAVRKFPRSAAFIDMKLRVRCSSTIECIFDKGLIIWLQYGLEKLLWQPIPEMEAKDSWLQISRSMNAAYSYMQTYRAYSSTISGILEGDFPILPIAINMKSFSAATTERYLFALLMALGTVFVQ